MKFSGRCPKCEGTELIADAKAVDKGDGNGRHDLEISTIQYPDALIFRGERRTTLSAWVCLKCGFVEYYADDPKALLVSD